MRIATWNINSLRIRLPQVLEWLTQHSPDILALQELKMPADAFPHDAFTEIGYTALVNGQKTWNGVALLIRQPLNGTDLLTEFPDFPDPQRRILCATINNVRVINLYIPNGESVGSEKYNYKLTWLSHLNTLLQQETKKYQRIVVLGDFNIAPANEDVHDPAAWEGKVLFSMPERQAFQTLLSYGLKDCFRLHPQSEKSFSWWDYRMNAFKRNLGLRIDHILASNALAATCTACHIDKAPRALPRPTDHTPVVADFAIEGF